LKTSGKIAEYIDALLASDRFRGQVAHHEVLPPVAARWAEAARPWPPPLAAALKAVGIEHLYSHQARALDLVRAGRHCVVATPTASGKSLVYNLPFFEHVGRDPAARAFYLFPLKALAQDQLRAFRALAAALGDGGPRAAIYDGDTSTWQRSKIRRDPPHAILTNPEMLHLGILPHHGRWADFLARLRVLVIDELHTYRGIAGAHMAQLLRRLWRVCAGYGAAPTVVLSSATVGNPEALARQLTGLEVHTIDRSGAPRGPRHLVLVDPIEGPARAAIALLKAALHRGLRTIVYTQSRRLAELIALWSAQQAGAFAGRISAYRAGLLPEERREIERRLAAGDLLAVIATSALELGIDIGDLDLCLLVGYPGSIVATWQRGGRVGRSGQPSALVLIAGEDALDQYFLRNPAELRNRPPEAAVVNPYNPGVLARHLVCAAAELPLKAGEPYLQAPGAAEVLDGLEQSGVLLRSAAGGDLFAARRAPHRKVDLRGGGERYTIVHAESGQVLGEIDAYRAFRETHPGAIYLHGGRSFRVEALDIAGRTVTAVPLRVDYYTRVRANKETWVLSVDQAGAAWGLGAFTGRLRISEQVTGYEKIRIRGQEKLAVLALHLPPQIFETEGVWFAVPREIQRAAEADQRHFMGALHALEHAAIGVAPLIVMADRGDLGGLATPFHPQVGGPAVFIYDAVPGGAGLSREAFQQAESLLAAAQQAIAACPCEHGCPSCVHSPKCGSGNRPIDKAGALFLLSRLRAAPPARPAPAVAAAKPLAAPPASNRAPRAVLRYGVFDLETQRSAEEVGGWHRADRMGLSCAVVYDAGRETYLEFLEDQVDELLALMRQLDLVVGFNSKRFDYRVLSGYTDFDFRRLPSLDILEEVKTRLGYRLSLDHLAQASLGARKSGDGLQALRWWKEGRVREVIDYCRSDVRLTRELFLLGRRQGHLLFHNKAGRTVRVPVDWRRFAVGSEGEGQTPGREGEPP
jgi:DEAD/DEAH box helicase domain-containing protein